MKTGEKREIEEYFAFISYNQYDFKWGKWLYDKFDCFSISETLCKQYGFAKNPARPVFFAPFDIQPGDLDDELKDRLKVSQHLVVICSPNSAKSNWVGKEIRYYKELKREKDIYLFIVGGVPNSNDDNECYHPVIKKLGLFKRLGANVTEKAEKCNWLNKELAFTKLVTKLLGIEVREVWQRRRRRLIISLICWIVSVFGIIIVILCVWKMSQPVDVKLKLNEVSYYNENLPPLNDAVVTLTLDNEKKTDTIRSLRSNAIFRNVPYRYMNKLVHFSMTCKDYMDVDTTLQLTEDVVLNIQRNPHIYGDITFDLWDNSGNGVPNVNIEIEGQKVKSDETGNVKMFIPLAKQKEKYHITSSVPLSKDTISVPCGENDIICVE